MLSSFFSLFSGENFTFLFVYFICKLRHNSQGLGSAVEEKGETKIGEGEKEIGKGSEPSVSLERGKGDTALSPPSPPFLLFHSVFCLFNSLRSLVSGYNIRNPQNVNQALEGTMSHYHDNKLKRVFESIKFQK